MYNKNIILYYIKIANTMKLETSVSNITRSISLGFAARLQKNLPSFPMMSVLI